MKIKITGAPTYANKASKKLIGKIGYFEIENDSYISHYFSPFGKSGWFNEISKLNDPKPIFVLPRLLVGYKYKIIDK